MDERRVEELLAERARRAAATEAQREAAFAALERERARGLWRRRAGAAGLAAAALLVAALLWGPPWGPPGRPRGPELIAGVELIDEGGRALGGGVRGAGAALPAPRSVLVEVELDAAGWARAILVGAGGALHAGPPEGALALEAGRAGWIPFEAGLFGLREGAGELDWIVLVARERPALDALRLPQAPLPRDGEARRAAVQSLARELERETGAVATLRGLSVEAAR